MTKKKNRKKKKKIEKTRVHGNCMVAAALWNLKVTSRRLKTGLPTPEQCFFFLVFLLWFSSLHIHLYLSFAETFEVNMCSSLYSHVCLCVSVPSCVRGILWNCNAPEKKKKKRQIKILIIFIYILSFLCHFLTHQQRE